MIGSSSKFDTHDDHQKSQIDIPSPCLPLPFLPLLARVRSDHRCSSNAKLIPSYLHSTTPTPSGFRSDERNGRSDSDFRFHWSDSDKDKTGETRIPGKKRKKGRACFKVGRRGSRGQLTLPHEHQTKKEDF
ncbi:hypothetical protein BPAE_0049g00170 [Botrytis paeoniae]|uniref:Uncharacterized protein n=1 Tax=Botrytis paeoniae TaxID=278948 RepID=A0A4Z1FUL8_9HELO|nr:hypothetical protein BPAE_0049g00170 [Botrytis paeoniae]